MGALTTEVFNESCCDGGIGCSDNSARSCGCDPGAGWTCLNHQPKRESAVSEYCYEEAVREAGTLGGTVHPDYYTSIPDYPPLKPSNPKDIIGSDKLPMSLVPGTSKAYQALGHLEGMLKYGLVNWRECGVRCSIYMDALERHLEKFKAGEWEAKDTKVPHLASMLACVGIIVDAYECGKLIDDRPMSAPVGDVIDRFSENVKHLKQMFKDHHPHHYTIADNKEG